LLAALFDLVLNEYQVKSNNVATLFVCSRCLFDRCVGRDHSLSNLPLAGCHPQKSSLARLHWGLASFVKIPEAQPNRYKKYYCDGISSTALSERRLSDGGN